MSGPTRRFDATGPIGFVIRFARGDWESYRIAGLELLGRHRTKAEAAFLPSGRPALSEPLARYGFFLFDQSVTAVTDSLSLPR
jgi:hypothetical protein